MIVAISVVKNSADVIESMIRGNSVITDQFVVMDNGSTDRTMEILGCLISEGFPIEVITDDDPVYVLQERYQKLFHYAIDKYHADFVIPLDDDEILCSNVEYIAPEEIKEHISALSEDNLYYVYWRNYIPTEEDDLSQISVTRRQTFCFDDEPEMTTKVIVPAKQITEHFSVAFGCHYADSDRVKNRVLLSEIRLAHYPVRSPEQIASKALVGWLNNLIIPNRKEGLSYHWERMYQVVKNGGLPSVEMMQMMCTLYRQCPNDAENLNIVRRPIRLPESAYDIRYTQNGEIRLLQNLCNNAESIAVRYVRLLEKNTKVQ